MSHVHRLGWLLTTFLVAQLAAQAIPTGPEIGRPLPDFTLPDQTGKMVRFTEARAGKKAIVVFFRSASW